MPQRPQDYRDRVYAGWLGKCIGVRFGAPLEGLSYREIAGTLGEVTTYLPHPPGKIFPPDDDTAVPLILIRALEDYGATVTAAQMGETMLNYLGDQRGTLWWGGYGVSTEHTAYLNLAGGIPAPRSGSMAQNGRVAAEQIGGQIFSDIWGFVAPGDPARAADYAAAASSVTHDGEGVHGGRFIAALVSQAFVTADPGALVEAGLSVIPGASEYARVVRAVRDFHTEHPDDWRACYRFIAGNFPYSRYGGAVPIIPNAGVVVMALLYGNGSFSRTIQIANMAGWDTDCNVGNAGAIMGVAAGLEGIEASWREPMNDVLVAAGIVGSRNLTDLAACAGLFCRLGAEVMGGAAATDLPRYHFDFPGSTQGFLARSKIARVIALGQVAGNSASGRGALQSVVRWLTGEGEVELYVKTGCRPDDLSANLYNASFSPRIYPGQAVTARVWVPPDTPATLLAAPFVWDDLHGQRHQAQAESLVPGQWQVLTFQVPALDNALLAEAGIVVRNLGEMWSGPVLLDSLDWAGAPCYSTDFSRERAEFGAISGWTFLRGYWRLEDGGYHGSGPGACETYTGDPAWQDLALTVDLRPVLGEHHNVNFRVQGARRSYAAGLAPDGRIVLYKNAGGYRPVAEARLPWRAGLRYTFEVAMEGARLSVSVTGEEHVTATLEWTDPDRPYLHGQIGLSTFSGSHTRYERVAVAGAGKRE